MHRTNHTLTQIDSVKLPVAAAMGCHLPSIEPRTVLVLLDTLLCAAVLLRLNRDGLVNKSKTDVPANLLSRPL